MNFSAPINEIEDRVEGDVYFDRLTRHIYATDASDFRKVPKAVVAPKHTGDIAAVIETCLKENISIIPRGGGSSVSGQTVGPGVVIDHTKYMGRLLELNVSEKWAWVEAGMNLDYLNNAIASSGLMVGPDPSSSAVATIGGMVGNNSTGSHSIKYRQISDHILEMEVVLSDGSIATLGPKSVDEVRKLASRADLEGRLYAKIPKLLKRYESDIASGFPGHWRNVAGYALNRLQKDFTEEGQFNLAPFIAGSEGTLATVSKVKLGLVDRPNYTYMLLLPFENLSIALETVPLLLEHPVAAIELMTYPTLRLAFNHQIYGPRIKRFINDLPGALLIVEFAGLKKDALVLEADRMVSRLPQSACLGDIIHCATQADIEQIWSIRKAVKGLQDSQPGATKRINTIDDPAVPIDQLNSFTKEVTEVGRKYGVELNFDAHASVGCLHLSPAINLRSPEGIRTLELMAKEIITIAIARHGTTTGEHGEGLARSYFTKQLYGERLLRAFTDIKELFDPNYLFNPRKIINPIEPWDENWLKFNSRYQTVARPDFTYFEYDKYGDFAGLVEMCNGQGTCRSRVIGAMCPSFRVTGDEKDTPRGRANILREALTGKFGADGFFSKEVLDALDLCLECKACKLECSSGVDIAKLKYEFLTLYHKRYGVPLRSRFFASMDKLNFFAALAPAISNRLYKNGAFRWFLDRVIGIDHRRSLPEIAARTFQDWFKRHKPPASCPNGPVILWDDCHLSTNQPELGVAAVHILESLGFEARIIKSRQCCGRPMISKGLLNKAREKARVNIDLLAPHIKEGIPVIGVEPSCVACFRDEYPELAPGEDSRLLADQTYFFEEFVNQFHEKNDISDFMNQGTPRAEIFAHTHCYQKALDQRDQVLDFLGLIPNSSVSEIGTGCCGMAGSFGYETEHYDISMRIGEDNLFKEIRGKPDDASLAASGTSCRQQIKDGTGKMARHPILLFAEALRTRDP